jgi:hypothetical protein
MAIILALGRLGQEDREFEASLSQKQKVLPASILPHLTPRPELSRLNLLRDQDLLPPW